MVMALAAVIAAVAIAYFVLDGFPNSGDEYAYLFQARQFAHGRLWADAPPLGYTFVPYRTWIVDGKWLSQYPPGWPLALALAIVASVPTWGVSALLAGAGITVFAARSWRFADSSILVVGVALYTLTPFYLLNAGSYHSHALSALLILLLCVCCLRYREDGGVLTLVAAGALLGLIGLTRYFSLLLLVPALLYWFLVDVRRRRVRSATVIALAGLPFLLLLMGYQYFISGNPFRDTYAVISAPEISLSLAPPHVLHGVVVTVYRLVELGVWASPIVPAIYLVCVAVKLRDRSLAFYDLIFPTFVVGFVFFPTLGVNRYGPRYYFEAFPLMLATILSAAPQAAAWMRQLWNRPLPIHASAASAFYLALALPFALAAYHAQVEKRQEPYRLAADMALSNAIVVIKTSSDAGLIADDLARNDDTTLRAPVLYARPDADITALEQTFPGRAIWIYERDDPARPGRLSLLHS
jgi:hypothetical protein